MPVTSLANGVIFHAHHRALVAPNHIAAEVPLIDNTHTLAVL